ncbi:MAG: hypothetical protein J0M30_14805 [Chitinophagales bacterium]|nr:hypothetical protein [Chitinophagales bacterium]
MAITKEIWQKDIVDNLFPDNSFARHARNADNFVKGGAVVHIPVAGASTAVTKNLGVFPQVAAQRNDTDITYALDTYYILPMLIKNIDQYELEYDKRMSVTGEMIKTLVSVVNKGLLYRWGPAAAQTILTTGALSGADLIDGTATGQRRLFTKTEFKNAAKAMDKKNLVGTRYALLTAAHYHQFFESLSDAEKADVGRVADLKTGVVGKYMNYNIMMRSAALRYRGADGAYVPIDETDAAFAANAADRAASLFWDDSCVERAMGDVDVFDDPGNPLYYGDVYSANLRVGGRIVRTDGVIAAVEANV